MDHLGRTVSKSAADIRSLNIYQEGETTHFGQVLDGCQVTHLCNTMSCGQTSYQDWSQHIETQISASRCVAGCHDMMWFTSS